jgi:hypothetical protein
MLKIEQLTFLKQYTNKSQTKERHNVNIDKGKTLNLKWKEKIMNENMKNNDFVGYEYKDVATKRVSASLYADCFPNFGWTLEGTSTPIGNVGTVTMKFKRDRKIRNKAELTRLQRQFEAQVTEIEAMERSKGFGASVAACTVGIIGTAFMAGSVFAITPGEPNIPLCIILAVPAFVGWILPYFLYSNVYRKKTGQVAPMIDGKYDEIFEVCEKANGLLA